MVARLCRLRLTLLTSEFRGSFWRGVRTTVLLIMLFALAVAAAAAPVWLGLDVEHRVAADIVVGAILLGALFFVPLFENRAHLEPRQFATYPVSSWSVSVALLVSTVLTWPFFALIAWLVALGVFRPEWHDPAWIVPAVLVGVAIMAVVSVRVSSAVSKLLVGPDRAGVLRAIGMVLLVAMLPITLFGLAAMLGSNPDAVTTDTVNVLSWTPFGAPFAGLHILAQGGSSAAMHFLVAGGYVVALSVLWPLIVDVSNRTVARPADPAIARRGLGWFERFAARPSQVIGARVLTYWARDPRYRVSLIAIPFAPIAMLGAFWVAGADLTSLAIVPLPVVLLLFAWSLHNDTAMDSTAIWVHVASGIRGWEDRLGRLAPIMLIGLPVAVIGSSLTVTVIGDWRILPAVIGMNVAVLFVASGVASVFSAMTPYPVTRPGDSPFVQPQWTGSGSGLAQTFSMLLAIALSIPAVWVAVSAMMNVEFLQNVWALAFGVGYGVVILGLGVVIGGKIFDRGAPELIGVMQVFD